MSSKETAIRGHFRGKLRVCLVTNLSVCKRSARYFSRNWRMSRWEKHRMPPWPESMSSRRHFTVFSLPCLLPWQIMYIIRVNTVFVMLSLCIHICKPFIDHITNMCKLRFTCYVLIFTTVHSERYLGTHLNYLNSIPPNYN